MEVGSGAFNLFENVVGLCGPDEGLGLAMVFFDTSEDAFLECWRAAQPAPAAPARISLWLGSLLAGQNYWGAIRIRCVLPFCKNTAK
jgi:hypothetical protein